MSRQARLGRRLAAALLVGVLAGTAACGAGRPEGSTAVPPASTLETATGLTTITFWHSMDSTNGVALQALVDRFNAAHQGKIKVEAVYQGAYDDAITKYKASVQSNTTPSLVQIYDIGTQFMIDSEQVVPIADFAARDGYDLSGIQRNIAAYYTVAGRQWSMPLNSSVPLLYYNKDAFRAAGLDPDRPPQNLDEIRAAAEKLKASGGKVPYGFGAAIYGWFLEQLLSTAGEVFCDPGNGRSGTRVTQAALDSPTVVAAVSWWQQMVADGLAVDTGRQTKDAQNAFKAQQTAITLESTGALKSFTSAADGQFDLGVAPFPTVSGSLAKGAGPSIGGASVWISGPGHTDAEKQAAWEFTRFLVQPDSQAFWHTQTGYFPVTDAARELPEEKAYLQKNPLFSVAIKSLDATDLAPTTTGCAAGAMPQIRKATEDGLEKALIGQDPARAMQTERADVARSIANYNDSVGP